MPSTCQAENNSILARAVQLYDRQGNSKMTYYHLILNLYSVICYQYFQPSLTASRQFFVSSLNKLVKVVLVRSPLAPPYNNRLKCEYFRPIQPIWTFSSSESHFLLYLSKSVIIFISCYLKIVYLE